MKQRAVGRRAGMRAVRPLAAIEPLEPRLQLSATPELVLDIETSILQDSGPSSLANVNGTLFFSAYRFPEHAQLWKSDGTAAGTALVKVIRPGGTALITEITDVNGTAYFSAFNGSSYGLWKSDGTTEGTQIVRDIAPGNDSSSPFLITTAGDRVFFGAGGDAPEGLWVSDGTAEGTEFLQGVPVPGFSGYFAEFTDVDGTLYFSAFDTETTMPLQLFRSDGTASGTGPLIIPNGGRPASLTNVNGTLFFSADHSAYGSELWKVAPPPRLEGDANGDGRISIGDYLRIDRGSARELSGFDNGDFNADGTIDAADYFIIDQAYLAQSGTPLSAADRSAMTAEGQVASIGVVPLMAPFSQTSMEPLGEDAERDELLASDETVLT